eukprot:8882381-Prorocentrum_lima.AAC.1
MKERCRGDLHQRGCDKCKRAMGHMRVHKHGTSNSPNVLSADLSGPHPVAIGTRYAYLLVAVFRVGSTNLPFVRGLPSKTAKE